MRELLLGYLLNALQPEERAAIEARLKTDAALRAQLAELRAWLKPFEQIERDFEPPPDLAERTCEAIWAAPASLPAPLPHEPSPGRWRLPDAIVATGISIALVLLIAPAINNSLINAELVACRNNLRQLGMALSQYSQFHSGYFPLVVSEGKLAGTGVYAPTLVETGFLTNTAVLVCPGSNLAAGEPFLVPSLKELNSAEEPQWNSLRRKMGGSYGYTLGYFKQGQYHHTRNQNREHFALAADAPSMHLAALQSANHGGRGQNVLFEAGQVAFWPTPKPHDASDGLFTNQTGYVAAGTCDSDAVIGNSLAVPVRDGF